MEDQVRITAAEGVDRLLDVAHEDHPIGEPGELHEDGELHRIGVLELVHQQELELLAQAPDDRGFIESAEYELLHVGKVDEASIALDLLESQ